MKALTVKQPWAWAIANSAKRIENRSRPTKHRGPLAIHAGASWSREGGRDERVITAVEPWVFEWDLPSIRTHGIDPACAGFFAFRRVIAVVDLIDCHPAAPAGCCAPWGDREGFHWVLGNVCALDDPIPANGRLGLWDIDLADPRAVTV
jgi:hypothetical protein